MDIKFEKLKPERRLIFNFKNEEGLIKFKEITSRKGSFSYIFNYQLSFKKQIKVWNMRLKTAVNECFQKVRLRNNIKKYSCKKFQKRKKAILTKSDKLRFHAENELSEEVAMENLYKLKSNITQLNNKTNGNHGNIWKIKNKFIPKIKPPIPVAKRNLANQIVTNQINLKKLYVKHFQHRMRQRPILNYF